jgi:S-adenosylmethionine decarboxylase
MVEFFENRTTASYQAPILVHILLKRRWRGAHVVDYKTFGRHVLADVWGVEFNRINDIEFLKEHMYKAAEKSGATILAMEYEVFKPCGATVLILLSESHLSIHTYPEKGFAAIDGYTCGDDVDPEVAINYLLSIFEPKKIYSSKIIRGTGDLQITQYSKVDEE